MALKRIIPVLQLHEGVLVKTTNFKKPKYIGDPVNTLRIFNELEVDEIAILDIRASLENRKPNLELIKTFCDECFMPLSYGGGITSVEQASEIFSLGYEKIIINTSAFLNPEFVDELAKEYGSQAIVVAMDIKKSLFGKTQKVVFKSATKKSKVPSIEWAKRFQDLGAGELIITNVDNEGTWKGLDIETTLDIASKVDIPVIIHGGASTINDINNSLKDHNISAVGLGNMVVYQGKGLGVLINFPNKDKFEGWE